MLERVDRKIDIKVGPTELIRGRPLYVCHLAYRRVGEPREFTKRHEQLTTAKEEPEAVPRDARDLNVCGARASAVRSCHDDFR